MGDHERPGGTMASAPDPKATPQLPVDEIRALAERTLGTRVHDLAPQAGSVGNQNFSLDTDDGRFALKLAAESELAAERWGLERAAGVGVPVPRVAAAGPLAEERGFLITEWLDGRPAVAETDSDALVDAGRAMRRFHRVTGSGYGRVDADGRVPRGRKDSWAEVIDGILAGIDDLVRHDVLSVRVAQLVWQAVADHRELIDYLGAGVLLHCDLKPAHLFVADGRLAAIIDWGDASLGDPRWDLARLQHAGDAVFAPVLEGYLREDRELQRAGLGPALLAGTAGSGDELDRSIACLSAVHRLDALHYELMAGGDWFDVYRATIYEWLDSVASATR